jgi:hypothetical protein
MKRRKEKKEKKRTKDETLRYEIILEHGVSRGMSPSQSPGALVDSSSLAVMYLDRIARMEALNWNLSLFYFLPPFSICDSLSFSLSSFRYVCSQSRPYALRK